MKLLCMLGYHLRSRRYARHDGQTFVSRCKRCGLAMRQGDDGKWSVEATSEAPPP